MVTLSEYLKNTYRDYIGNLIITVVFLFMLIWGYVIIYSQKEHIAFDLLILCCVVSLFFFLIEPAYKILRGNARWWEMRNISLAPFGIGLLRIYWTPYKRMAKRLVNEQAIIICRNAINNMKNAVGNQFGKELEQFEKWYPKIEESERNSKLRYIMVKCYIMLTKMRRAGKKISECDHLLKKMLALNAELIIIEMYKNQN